MANDPTTIIQAKSCVRLHKGYNDGIKKLKLKRDRVQRETRKERGPPAMNLMYSSSEGDEESGGTDCVTLKRECLETVSATPSPSCSESSGIAEGDSKTEGSLMKASTGPAGATVKKEDIEANESIRYGGVASKALNRLMLTALTGKLCALLTKEMKDRLLTLLALQLQSGKVEPTEAYQKLPHLSAGLPMEMLFIRVDLFQQERAMLFPLHSLVSKFVRILDHMSRLMIFMSLD
ncbi:hypothetical protein DFJ43DRAFT_1041815 [Lentinula guzmanii]|uniref:Uncharacterized protein n=1 Tax=Lentinula guzmanii TaxID=2804957 RepID=A0AA38JDT4_9AGAR|nr:hypothetical protein DFJ43DRAFT_1041815 [Lentinula guzmanii]